MLAALGLIILSGSVRGYLLGGGNNAKIANLLHPLSSSVPWGRHAAVPIITSRKRTEHAAETTATDAELRNHPMRIAYQGEPGAYSEKAAKELLGDRILTMGHKVGRSKRRGLCSR